MSARRVLAITVAVLSGALVASAAQGRSTVDDLMLRAGSQIQTGTGPVYVISSLAFPLEFVVTTDGGPQTITLRFSLPPGLSFTTAPTAAEGCAVGPPVVCQLSPITNEAGSMEWRKTWGIVAAAPGSYEVMSSVEGQRPDPNSGNNTHTFRFEVRTSSAGAGGGGGSVTVSAGAIKLTPAKPKAGAAVVANATVTADGSPVKPSKVVCAGTLAGRKAVSTGKAAAGLASCRYATRKTDKGKTLAGSMAITARGTTITKRFSTRLG